MLAEDALKATLTDLVSQNLIPSYDDLPSIIHFMRHAKVKEGNIQQDTNDPDISATGRNQCETFAESFKDSEHITHVVCSPLTRTISTAFLSFPKVVERGVQVVVIPELKNHLAKSTTVLRKMYGMHIDVTRLPKDQVSTRSSLQKSPARIVVEDQMASVMKWLWGTRSEMKWKRTEIVVVIHMSDQPTAVKDEVLPRGGIVSFKMAGEQMLERITPGQVKEIRTQQYARIEEEKKVQEEKDGRKSERDPRDWARILRPRTAKVV